LIGRLCASLTGVGNGGLGMSETQIQQAVRLSCSQGPARLWRNNSGKLPDPKTGRWVQFGVASPGGSDLIGYRQVVIGPEHVGRTMAVFTAVEVKTATGRATKEQTAFVEHVKQAGGIAGVVRSVDDARGLLGLD
jgi:hypothetical protein